MPTIKLLYEMREYFRDFHERDARWAILVLHRRAGKTVGVVNDLLEKAAYNTRPNPRYGYVAPLYNQAKQIAWQYLKDYSAPFNPKASESALYVELPHNGARVTLYGADNPDSFRGLYFDGVALDEFGNMRKSIWTEVLLPTLIDRNGWAVFMGTPNGPNHFRDMYEEYKNDPGWFVKRMAVGDTNIISPQNLAEIKKIMTEEEYAQEMLCDFSASTRGAFYSREIADAEHSGRIRDVPFDSQPLNFVFDLGFRDDTAWWGWQERPDGIAIQVAASDNRRAIPWYIEMIHATCKVYGVPLGTVWLPHDARAKSLQTGRSIVEQFTQAGIYPQIVPRLDILDGIAAARMLLPFCYFDEKRCKDGIMALKSYHREYDEDKKVFGNNPVHDWSSHYADAFRYLAHVAQKRGTLVEDMTEEQRMHHQRDLVSAGMHYAFNLEDLFKHKSIRRSRD